MFEWLDWIGRWDEMRFYYSSVLSWLILLPLYAGGLVVLGLLAWLLTKVWKYGWALVIPLIPVLAISPWWEEYNIAWNFGQLCKKDAGIFIYKTVEVEGFYDDTSHWWRQLAESDYKWVESRERGPNVIWRVERDGDELKHYKIDEPTARYHYRWPSDTRMSHKVDKIERMIVDRESDEVLARETKYRREAPWFFIGLDKPVMLCPSPGEHPLSKYGSVFNLVLKPKAGD